MKLISTAALGDGAFGTVLLFTAPQGQRMHFLGNIPIEKVPKLNESTTTQAGEGPVAPCKVKSLLARTSTGAKIGKGYDIRLNGKSVFKGDLPYDGPVSFAPIEVQKDDVFEVSVSLQTEPPLDIAPRDAKGAKLPFNPKDPAMVLLTLELEADPS